MATPTHLNPAYIAPSAWWEHVPLAHWLIETLRPKVVVELGTHYGVSFFAFCQAAKLFSPDSFIYAVDTWTGDEHAGEYEDSIYQQVLLHQQVNYRQNSTLLRQSFDDTLAYFADGTIDLLHIDGLHTYEAVLHDFTTWLPKLSPQGTILFHDINVRERGFGVWKLWSEIRESPQLKCLEVAYGSGLGIASQGEVVPAWHSEFKLYLKDFQARGSLFLELAGNHLGLIEAQAANRRLADEIIVLKSQIQTHETERIGDYTQQSASEPPANNEDQLAIISQEQGTRLSAKPKGGTRLYVHRHSIRTLINKVKSKGARILRLRATPRPTGLDNLKVVFISGEPHTPGHLYRVKRYGDSYAALGASVTILTPSEIPRSLDIIAGCEILSLWRIPWSSDLGAAIDACRMNGGQIVFDVDDLMIRPELARAKVIDGIRINRFDEAETAKLFQRVQQTMLAADVCVTTTNELATQMRLFGKPVVVMPNGYDEHTFATARLADRRRQAEAPANVVRIGYASGSLTHQKDFQACYPAVVSALKRHPHLRLVLFRDDNNTPCLEISEFPELASLKSQIEWRELVGIEELPSELARFDINIIPLEIGNVFTESKSELKFFEAALAGVCSIASPTGPFRRIIRNGETGLLASTTEEWDHHLESLISNQALRKQFAQAALADTLFSYGPVYRTQQVAKLATYLTRPAARGMIFQNLIHAETMGTLPGTIEIPPFDIIVSHDQLRPSSVTVVIPLFNYKAYIIEALDSVKSQTLANIDLIIVDDKSTDDSLRVAKKWLEENYQHFNRSILACNHENSKLGPTRNVGFHLAESEYIFALDADNRLAPDCLERCYAIACQRKTAYVYPTLKEFGASSGQIGNLEYMPLKLVSGNYIDAMALVSKAAWLHIGGYRNIKYGWEDYELWCRFAEAGLDATHAGSQPLAYYRVHEKSMLRTTTDEEDNKHELIDTMEKLHPWLHISTPPKDIADSLDCPQHGEMHDVVQYALEDSHRLQRLLPILRCPTSHRPLQIDDDRLTVKDAPDVEWPLVHGIPNLFAGLSTPMIKDEQHISHPLPDHIQAKIQGTSGWVLNLSAGGSSQKDANIVEVEFALFRNTDVIADAHELPFISECFDGIVCMNAFEHYSEPKKVASELLRVLKPGGWIVVQTAFLQPEHEYPWHFYNTTSEGLRLWFRDFNIEAIRVSDNFNPLYSLGWLASQCETSLRQDVSADAADRFRSTPIQSLVEAWNHSRTNEMELWEYFHRISQEKQRAIAAGFELLASKPIP